MLKAIRRPKVLALLAALSFLVALLLDLFDSTIDFPFVVLGLLLLALHFVYPRDVGIGRRL